MKKINNKFLIILTLFTLLFLTFFTTQTFAWLSFDKQYDAQLNFGSFKVTIYSKNKEELLPITKGGYKLNALSEKDSIDINNIIGTETGVNENKNYFENFKMNIKVKADINGYLRIKILDEWTVRKKFLNFDRDKTEVIYIKNKTNTSFNLAPNWVYDEKTNYCYYTKIIEKNTTEVDIPFILSGVSYIPKINAYVVETCDLKLGFLVEIVQANRFEDKWGIEEIPKNISNKLIERGKYNE